TISSILSSTSINILPILSAFIFPRKTGRFFSLHWQPTLSHLPPEPARCAHTLLLTVQKRSPALRSRRLFPINPLQTPKQTDRWPESAPTPTWWPATGPSSILPLTYCCTNSPFSFCKPPSSF